MKKYFISHEASSIIDAVKLKELLTNLNSEHEIFLTSDWSSLGAGSLWMQDIISALLEADEIIVLITRKEAFKNLWINFEIGVAIGRKIKPKILVWGGVDLSDMQFPMKAFQAISTGNTNRWQKEFGKLDYQIKDTEPFAKLFKQAV